MIYNSKRLTSYVLIAILIVVASYLLVFWRPWKAGSPHLSHSIEESIDLNTFINKYEAKVISYDSSFDVKYVREAWTEYHATETSFNNCVDLDTRFIQLNLRFPESNYQFDFDAACLGSWFYKNNNQLIVDDIYRKNLPSIARKKINEGFSPIYFNRDTIQIVFNEENPKDITQRKKYGMIELVKVE